MWQKVATEMGIPWRSAESMHWQLGEQEMSARANAPVFQLHPSAAGTGLSSQSQVPAIPVSTPHGFTPANTTPLMPPQLPQLPNIMPQGPIHDYRQPTYSVSSAGGLERRSSSFSRTRVDPQSAFSYPRQLHQPLPQIQPQSEEGFISGPEMHPAIKREGERPSSVHACHKSRLEEEAAGLLPMLQGNATGGIKIKREPKETEPIYTAPSKASEYTSLFEKESQIGLGTLDNSTCIVTGTDQPGNSGLVRTAASTFC